MQLVPKPTEARRWPMASVWAEMRSSTYVHTHTAHLSMYASAFLIIYCTE